MDEFKMVGRKRMITREEFRAMYENQPAITPKPKDPVKPCPFCGCDSELVHYEDEAGSLGYSIRCKNTDCLCNLGFTYIWTDVESGQFDTPEEAITAWNTRFNPGQDNRSESIVEKDPCECGCNECPDRIACNS